jgi:hypothetical protein
MIDTTIHDCNWTMGTNENVKQQAIDKPPGFESGSFDSYFRRDTRKSLLGTVTKEMTVSRPCDYLKGI